MAKLLLEVPEELRMAFRIKCLQNGTNMKTEIIRFMESYIKEGGGKTKVKKK